MEVAVEYGRAGESLLVPTEDIECGGVGSGGAPLPWQVAGPGAAVVGRHSGAASLRPGMCDDCWSSIVLPAANDKCLPFCCGDRDDGKVKSLDRAVLGGSWRGIWEKGRQADRLVQKEK